MMALLHLYLVVAAAYSYNDKTIVPKPWAATYLKCTVQERCPTGTEAARARRTRVERVALAAVSKPQPRHPRTIILCLPFSLAAFSIRLTSTHRKSARNAPAAGVHGRRPPPPVAPPPPPPSLRPHPRPRTNLPPTLIEISWRKTSSLLPPTPTTTATLFPVATWLLGVAAGAGGAALGAILVVQTPWPKLTRGVARSHTENQGFLLGGGAARGTRRGGRRVATAMSVTLVLPARGVNRPHVKGCSS